MKQADQAKRQAKLQELRQKRTELSGNPAKGGGQGAGEGGRGDGAGRLMKLLAERRQGGDGAGGGQGRGGGKAAGAGGGDGGGRLMKLLAERRQGGGAGGGLQGKGGAGGLGRLRGKMEGGERDMKDFPLMKRALAGETLPDEDMDKLRAGLKKRIQGLEDMLDKIDRGGGDTAKTAGSVEAAPGNTSAGPAQAKITAKAPAKQKRAKAPAKQKGAKAPAKRKRAAGKKG